MSESERQESSEISEITDRLEFAVWEKSDMIEVIKDALDQSNKDHPGSELLDTGALVASVESALNSDRQTQERVVNSFRDGEIMRLPLNEIKLEGKGNKNSTSVHFSSNDYTSGELWIATDGAGQRFSSVYLNFNDIKQLSDIRGGQVAVENLLRSELNDNLSSV